MKECFYCGEVWDPMHRVERNCNCCKDHWAHVCQPCLKEYKDSGSIGWDKHYETHHYPIDLV